MNNVYLVHHGILGQKWGVRRFQNKDGTRTELGKERSRNKDYQNLGYAANAANAASNAAQRAANISNRSTSRRRSEEAQKIDLSEMTDAELQRAVNRMNLERNYRNLSTENINNGRRHTADILSNAGDVLAITGSALTIALMIKQIRE